MAAEILRTDDEVRAKYRGFNEAAANGRGNPGVPLQKYISSIASMRPRRMAAEIFGQPAQADNGAGASMRPRRMAAEIGIGVGDYIRVGTASMRPRRMAAEIRPASPHRHPRRWLQ